MLSRRLFMKEVALGTAGAGIGLVGFSGSILAAPSISAVADNESLPAYLLRNFGEVDSTLYAQVLGADLLIFDDRKVATHMAQFMGGQPHQKRALLAMNANGGSGYELWQYQDREPQAAKQPVLLGEFQIFACLFPLLHQEHFPLYPL